MKRYRTYDGERDETQIRRQKSDNWSKSNFLNTHLLPLSSEAISCCCCRTGSVSVSTVGPRLSCRWDGPATGAGPPSPRQDGPGLDAEDVSSRFSDLTKIQNCFYTRLSLSTWKFDKATQHIQ
jgi:hypothetical protein